MEALRAAKFNFDLFSPIECAGNGPNYSAPKQPLTGAQKGLGRDALGANVSVPVITLCEPQENVNQSTSTVHQSGTNVTKSSFLHCCLNHPRSISDFKTTLSLHTRLLHITRLPYKYTSTPYLVSVLLIRTILTSISCCSLVPFHHIPTNLYEQCI